jgi:hypothetical protein
MEKQAHLRCFLRKIAAKNPILLSLEKRILPNFQYLLLMLYRVPNSQAMPQQNPT